VQGVWFRAGTREQASILGLSGYAGNLKDGSVVVQAQGDADSIGKLEQWLQYGPPLAQVNRVESVEIAVQAAETDFRIL